MTIATFTDSDNYTFRVFSSMYLDWGLEIIGPNGEELYYSPSSLCRESYGFKPNPARDFVDFEDAEQSALDGDDDAFVPWEESDWRECLKDEGDQLIEAYTVYCVSCENVVNPENSRMFNLEFFCDGCSPN